MEGVSGILDPDLVADGRLRTGEHFRSNLAIRPYAIYVRMPSEKRDHVDGTGTGCDFHERIRIDRKIASDPIESRSEPGP
jgi:hypothetical protein